MRDFEMGRGNTKSDGGKMIPILRPCWQRPEILKLSLEYQQEAVDLDKFITVFVVDYPQSDEIMCVIGDYKPPKAIILRKQWYNLTRSILEAYKWIFEDFNADMVVTIEEDAIIAKDFLKLALWFRENPISSEVLTLNSGWLEELAVRQDDNKLHKINWHFPVAIGVMRNMFEKYVLPHCHEGYYNNAPSYLWEHFPDIWKRGSNTGQAGLFNRIRIKNNLQVLCPEVRRAGHIGVYGFFQGGNKFGELSEPAKYEVLKQYACDGKFLRQLAEGQNPDNFVDFNPNTDFKALYIDTETKCPAEDAPFRFPE
jgi:hypothetical protein